VVDTSNTDDTTVVTEPDPTVVTEPDVTVGTEGDATVGTEGDATGTEIDPAAKVDEALDNLDDLNKELDELSNSAGEPSEDTQL
jgi:hypothetical protein